MQELKQPIFVLIVEYSADNDGPDAHGPFYSEAEAQAYARKYREVNNIPGSINDDPSPEENEAWEDDGWTFSIQELSKPFDIGLTTC